MTAKEADLEALDVVMRFCTERVLTSPNKYAKAYQRIYKRLQAVYIRTDAALNKVEGNA